VTDAPAVRKTLRLRIRGGVQGVFFRDAMRREANALRIAGWVRNRSDGSVEAVVQGAPEDVDGIVRWAHRGPPSAQVTDVEIDEDAGAYSAFEVRHD
jgi:acylphosphatase